MLIPWRNSSPPPALQKGAQTHVANPRSDSEKKKEKKKNPPVLTRLPLPRLGKRSVLTGWLQASAGLVNEKATRGVWWQGGAVLTALGGGGGQSLSLFLQYPKSIARF
jgi:hypothetical protein